jgi:uncharacterized protein (TIGR02058 family)
MTRRSPTRPSTAVASKCDDHDFVITVTNRERVTSKRYHTMRAFALRALAVARRYPTSPSTSSSSSRGRRYARAANERDAERNPPVLEYDDGVRVYAPNGMTRVLFSECGFGADQHGQDATKAAMRACRNAIEFNSIPSVRELVPGGYDGMKLHVHLGVPEGCTVDLDRVKTVFPYGTMLPIAVDVGGLKTRSWISIPAQDDANDDFLVCVANVSVGY